MNFLKIWVIEDKSKPTRVAMIWLRFTVLLAVPFIEMGGKQKIIIASICNKKEIL